MAHFAKLDENNVVLEVLVVNNEVLRSEGGDDEESMGIEFLKGLFGAATHWMQTSYNGSLRKNYAAIGGVYDPAREAFISPQPYPSWILDEVTCQWDAPVPFPDSEIPHIWDEQICEWVAAQAA